MRRRDFLAGLAAASIGSSSTVRRAAALTSATASSDQISELFVESSSSLLDASYGELTDPNVLSVHLEDTAENVDEDGNGDAVIYSEATDVPVSATDGNVVGFGWMVVEDGTNWQYGNEEFLLNVWDEHAGGGTVLYDEGHGQYYTLADFSEFEDYAENNGYTVQATTSLASDLSNADAAWITSPSTSFTNSELSALADFVANGGAVFLHDESDYSDYDETGNLNEIAGDLGLAFRFNDDQVIDEVVNASADYEPETDEFNTNFPYFTDRSGLGLDPTKTYDVTVTSVTDGDTADVEFSDGSTESVRILGLDTPETSSNSQYERVQEWEGIESNTYLENWADEATQFCKDEIGGKTVDLYFDSEEPVRDAFGRVLGYIDYDRNGDGSRSTNYNYQCVTKGYARIYDSGFSKHESFWQAENDARANKRRVWTESDPENTSEIRDRPVDDVFMPKCASVRTSSGAISDSRVPVYAESSAYQDIDGGYDYGSSDLPLVGVDESNRVGLVGAPFVDESYESEEGFDVDTSDFENYVFAINLADYLTADGVSGDVLVDGSHGQFDANYGLSAEDTAWWMRYLEGQDVGLEGINELTASNLSRGRTLVITTPEEAFTTSEVDAISSFVADGGSVVLLGCGKVTSEARANLNDLAAALGTDLRVNEDQVLDDTNNVNSDPEIPATTQFDTSFPLFDAYTSDGGDGGGSSGGEIAIDLIHADASGDDNDNLNDEYVVFENIGTETLDLTGWSVEDEVAKTYNFPDNFTLDPQAQVTLHTGSGTDSSTDLYWGRGSAVWNNSGDTVFVYDDQGAEVLSRTYSGSGGTSVEVSTGSATNVTDTSATLTGSLDDLGGASSADCYFEYREVGASSWTSTTVQTRSSTGSFSQDVSGLSTGVDYEFRARSDASDSYTDGGATATFTTGGDASVAVSTDSASGVTATEATFNGTLDDLGGASSADCYFEYREVGASSWTATSAQTLSATGSFSDTVSGLAENTDYEFRAVADASDGDSDAGNAVTFTTSDDPAAVSTGSATDVTETSATLNGTLDDLGGASSADCYFQYRQVGASTWTETAPQTLSATGSFSESVSGLAENTDYEFRARTDASDGDSDTGATATFTTSGDTSVVVSTGSASSVTGSSATLNGSLDDLGGASSADCYFEYRQAGSSSWTATSPQTRSSTGSFSDTVSGLASGTDYEFRAVADASDGDSDTGTTSTFTTTSSATAPSIDSYVVTEAGSPNPHAEITADWDVSDADGDLSSVLVEVFDSSGTRVDYSRTSVSGASASGTDQFKVKKANNETFDVVLTVTDATDRTATATRTVTE